MNSQLISESATTDSESNAAKSRAPLPPSILSLTDDEFAKMLKERLGQRSAKDGAAFYLNLRAEKLGNLGRPLLLDPNSAGWPDRGTTTTDRAQAETWAADARVVKYLRDRIKLQLATPGQGRMTVREAAEAYVRPMLKTRTVEVKVDGGWMREEQQYVPKKLRSRVSCIRRHVVPALGKLELNAVSAPILRRAVDAAMKSENVRNPKTGRVVPGVTVPAPVEYGTKLNIIRAMSAIWRHAYPDLMPPFDGAAPTPPASEGEEDQPPDVDANAEIIQGTNGALLPAELASVLVAAMRWDAEMSGRSNLMSVIEPTTAHGIALQACLGARVSELMTIQWQQVNLVRGWVYVRNAKQKQVLVAARAVPIQDSLVPWLYDLWLLTLAEHRRRTGRPMEYGPFPIEEVGKELPKALLIRTNRGAPLNKRGAATTLGRKFGLAQEVAGVKKTGKATHNLRSTFASYADMAPGLSTRDMQRYLGHHVHKGSTERYVAQMVRDMTPEHRQIVRIPTPEQIRAQPTSFEPGALPEWDERKLVTSRSNAARNARAARGPRKTLGVSLDLPKKPVYAEAELRRRKRPRIVPSVREA